MTPNYNLDRLGWKNFQHLCAIILRESLGQTFQTFADGNDAGRDGAFNGIWLTQKGESLHGSFTAQCKHTSRSDAAFKFSMLRHELAKAKRLAERGLADNYLLLTNYSVSAEVGRRVEEAFEELPGINECRVFDRSWIEGQIHGNTNLRTLFPRIYGLGDLTQILDGRAYAQAQAILKHLGSDFACFVPTKSYHDSVLAMNEKGFVFLLGEPCCGKSTIASSLALASVDKWGCGLVRVDKPSHFRDHWNPEEPHQFFWVDDAFGTTQYERELALEWTRNFSALQAAISKGARVVFTSRDYIYRAAMEDLKEGAFPLLRDAQVVIRVEQITRVEREQILYNHIKLGSQPSSLKKAIRDYLSDIAAHERFLPETARRLANPFFTEKLTCDRKPLLEFVENMKEFLIDNLKTFGDANRAAVALVFMRKGNLDCELTLSAREQHAISLLGSDVGQIKKALIALSPTLLLSTEDEGLPCWKFKHPSIRDAFGTYISDDPSLRSIYLENTEVRTLLTEIACGVANLEGVKLQVPEAMYRTVLERLVELDREDAADLSAIVQFLRNRAGESFLRAFLGHAEDFLDDLRVGSWMRYNNATRLVARLHSFGLLPEEHRERFASQMMNNTLWFADASCFDLPELGNVLTESEKAALRRTLKKSLMGHLRDSITSARTECIASASDASEEFWELTRNLRQFRNQFRETRGFDQRLRQAQERIERIVMRIGQSKRRTDEKILSDDGESEVAGRSVFDDVHQ